MLSHRLVVIALLCLAVGLLGGWFGHSHHISTRDIEDEGALRLAQDLFQDHPYFFVEGTDWVLQVTYDGQIWQGHEWQRWSDGALREITGY